MDRSIQIMKNRIVNILTANKPSIYLYGSIVLEDFKLGWSDIDILCLTEEKISNEQANQLVNLRQDLLKEYANNLYFCSFEGGFATLDNFINHIPDTTVYWGTSGQRITNSHGIDPFSMIELLENGYLLYGDDIRYKFSYPTEDDIREAVISHYEIIRRYAVSTKEACIQQGGFWI